MISTVKPAGPRRVQVKMYEFDGNRTGEWTKPVRSRGLTLYGATIAEVEAAIRKLFGNGKGSNAIPSKGKGK